MFDGKMRLTPIFVLTALGESIFSDENVVLANSWSTTVEK